MELLFVFVVVSTVASVWRVDRFGRVALPTDRKKEVIVALIIVLGEEFICCGIHDRILGDIFGDGCICL